QELNLLAALLSHCEKATVTFCLDKAPGKRASWLSTWSVIQRNFEECRKRLGSLPGVDLAVETVSRSAGGRFAESLVLAQLEKEWAEEGCEHEERVEDEDEQVPSLGNKEEVEAEEEGGANESLRIAVCANPEAEAITAAREILRHVRAGGRFREVAVLAR